MAFCRLAHFTLAIAPTTLVYALWCGRIQQKIGVLFQVRDFVEAVTLIAVIDL